MTGDECDKVELYCINDDKVQMALIDAEYRARALIWTMDDGQRLLDRQYGDPEACNHLYNWAKNQGWKCWQDRDDLDLKVTLEVPDKWPYMDTMRYAKMEGCKVILYSDSCKRHDHCLDRTDGELEDSMCCCSCEDGIDEDNAYYQEGDGPYCNSCFRERYSCCDRCSEDFPADDGVTVNNDGEETWCQSCAERHAFYCEHSEEYYSTRRHNSVDVDGETWELSQAESNAYFWDEEWHEDPEPEKEDEEESEVVNEVA
jgi:hypothetical protein